MSDSRIWRETIAPSDAPLVVEAGEVRIFLRVTEGDWFAGVLRDKGDRRPGLARQEEMPPGVDWQRIGSVDVVPEIRIRPCFPDRPVVVRPEVVFSVLPGERVQFFVGVPVSLRLEGAEGLMLMQVPAYTLSNTWFGMPTEGELCYAMRTLARREGEKLDFGPLRVICPVRIRNQSKSALHFERLCLRTRALSLYRDPVKGLWANESGVIVRSDQSWSRVAYARKPPSLLDAPERLAKGEEETHGTQLLRALSIGKGWFQ